MIDHFWVLPGRLGGGSHPGRQGELDAQLRTLTELGYGAVLTLTETGLGQSALERAGLEGLHIPIPDSGAPGIGQMERATEFFAACDRNERALFVHCFAGYGRTGVIIAGLLIAAGEEPRRAITRVRHARPGAIESARQERFLLGLGPGSD